MNPLRYIGGDCAPDQCTRNLYSVNVQWGEICIFLIKAHVFEQINEGPNLCWTFFRASYLEFTGRLLPRLHKVLICPLERVALLYSSCFPDKAVFDLVSEVEVLRNCDYVSTMASESEGRCVCSSSAVEISQITKLILGFGPLWVLLRGTPTEHQLTPG